mgnify:CR=1 FL=1
MWIGHAGPFPVKTGAFDGLEASLDAHAQGVPGRTDLFRRQVGKQQPGVLLTVGPEHQQELRDPGEGEVVDLHGGCRQRHQAGGCQRNAGQHDERFSPLADRAAALAAEAGELARDVAAVADQVELDPASRAAVTTGAMRSGSPSRATTVAR